MNSLQQTKPAQTVKGKGMTLQEIKDYAASIGLVFTDRDAQLVIDTKPDWCDIEETVQEAVDDFISAYGA
jgi:hypothetical protein